MNTLSKNKNTLKILLLITSFISISLICLNIRLVAIDDVMYAGFSHHGIQNFFEKFVWHYNNFNGRTFIHMVLSIILTGKQYIYAILMPLFILLSFYFFSRVFSKNKSIIDNAYRIFLCTCFFIAIGWRYLESTLIWMAGGINYIFPFFIASIGIFWFIKNKDKTKVSIPLVLYLLLCGATTEQYGMFVAGTLFLIMFFDVLDKTSRNFKLFSRNVLCYLLPVMLGILSILLSPATLDRIINAQSYNQSTNSSFIMTATNNFQYLTGRFGNIFIVMAFGLLLGICAIGKNHNVPKKMVICIPISICICVVRIIYMMNMCYFLTLILFVFSILTLIFDKQNRIYGIVLFCGFGTFAMMCITYAAGTRTTLPLILSMIVVATNLIVDRFKILTNSNSKIKLFIIPFAVLCAVVPFCYQFADLYYGTKNAIKFNENVFSYITSKDGDVVEINFDETLSSSKPKYRYPTFFDNPDIHQYNMYSEYEEPSENVKLSFVTNSDEMKLYTIIYNNKPSIAPAFEKNKKLYIPVKVVLNEKKYNFGFYGSLYNFVKTNNTELRFYIKDDKVTKYDCSTGTENILYDKIDQIRISQYGGTLWLLSADDFCEIFNMKTEFNENGELVITER